MSHTLSLALSLLITVSAPVTEQPVTGEPAIRDPLAAPAPAPAPKLHIPEPPTGQRLVVAGAVLMAASIPLTGIGIRLAAAGAFSEGEQVRGVRLAMPLLVLALASLLAGIPMVSVGAHRRNNWRAWERMHRVSLRPNLHHRTGSTSIGLTLRF